jgi:predicted ArsR family transcriptional regulator
MAEWKFFTNHALVLLCLANDPDMLLREIADAVGITERAAHRIIGDLEEGGFISRERKGRRNYYQVHPEAALSQPGLDHPMLKGRTMGEIAVSYIAAGRRNVGDDLPAEAERAAQQARRASARTANAAGARARASSSQ